LTATFELSSLSGENSQFRGTSGSLESQTLPILFTDT
jgi:hypothetical protein